MTEYRWRRLLAAMAVVGTLVSASACSSQDPPTDNTAPLTTSAAPLTSSPSFKVDRIDDTGKLRVLKYTATENATVDITGLEVDIPCARDWHFTVTNPNDIRVELVRLGCARITTANPSDAEAEAQASAKSSHQGIWAAGAGPAAAPTADQDQETAFSRWLAGLPRWLHDHWFDAAGVLLALLGLSWVAKALDNWRLRKRVDVVLTGMPSAGKSDLWLAWRDEAAPESNSKPSPAVRTSSHLPPIPVSKYTLEPRVVDSAGSDPASVLNFMAKSSRRRRRVLVFVIAPTKKNVKDSPEFDHDFITQQDGYSYFARAIIGAQYRKFRPKLAVLFITKFDLVSEHAPQDTTSAAMKAQVESKFAAITTAVRSACDKYHVPYRLIIGSSKHENWGVEVLQRTVARVVLTGKA